VVAHQGVYKDASPEGLAFCPQKLAGMDTQARNWEALLAAALIAATVGAGLPNELMPKVHAEESSVERRRSEAIKRKELLSKAYVPLKARHQCHEAHSQPCTLERQGCLLHAYLV
jgi:hypothetical protein